MSRQLNKWSWHSVKRLALKFGESSAYGHNLRSQHWVSEQRLRNEKAKGPNMRVSQEV